MDREAKASPRRISLRTVIPALKWLRRQKDLPVSLFGVVDDRLHSLRVVIDASNSRPSPSILSQVTFTSELLSATAGSAAETGFGKRPEGTGLYMKHALMLWY
jgi:hypothetical protein